MASAEKLRAQRDQAIACAVLAVVVSTALIADNFLQHRRELVVAHQQILELQNVLGATQDALRQNERALITTQKALAGVKPSRR